MPLKTLIASAATSFVIVLTLVLVPGHLAQDETRTVDFSTAPPRAPGPPGALESARAYAATNGLTDCVAPAHARLDDVVLTVPDDPTAVAAVTMVDFDEALRSAENGRWNVLACALPGTAPAVGSGAVDDGR